MLYEARIYTFKVGGMPQWLANFTEAYEVRQKYSKLGGLWYTELGPLNQAIHIWPYNDLQERADIRAAAAKDPSGLWPPKGGGDYILSQEVDVLEPVKNMEDWTGPQQWGEVYELRMYTYAPGDIGKAAAAFGEALPGRHAVYPVAGMWTTQMGNLNRLYQFFPYKSWAHREEVRAEFRKHGVWPPHSEVRPVSQLVRMLLPAPVSPIH
jgi:hypothetical protein